MNKKLQENNDRKLLLQLKNNACVNISGRKRIEISLLIISKRKSLPFICMYNLVNYTSVGSKSLCFDNTENLIIQKFRF